MLYFAFVTGQLTMKTPFWPIFFAVWLGGVAAFATVNTFSSLYQARRASEQAKASVIQSIERQISTARETLGMFDRGELSSIATLEDSARLLRSTAGMKSDFVPTDLTDAANKLADEMDAAAKQWRKR